MKNLKAVLPTKIKIRSGYNGDEYSTLDNGVTVSYSGFSKTYTISHKLFFTSASFKDIPLTRELVSILSKKDNDYLSQFRYMNDVLQNLKNNKEIE